MSKMDCSFCVEHKGENPKCDHEMDQNPHYGFAKVSGWKGLGVHWRCKKCSQTLWFEDDQECNTGSEISHNELKRAQNIQWGPKEGAP